MKLEDKREAFKAFFTVSPAGKELYESMVKAMDSNIDKAMGDNSLDFLSRAKGNQEMIALVDNVLRTEVSK